MKRILLFLIPIVICLSFFMSKAYCSSSSGVTVFPNVYFKPNFIHTYYFTQTQTLNNITFPATNTLGLAKNNNLIQIGSSTTDNITIKIISWFDSIPEGYKVKFQPISEDNGNMIFTINTGSYGQPDDIENVLSWSWSEPTVTLTCSSHSYPTLIWSLSIYIVNNFYLFIGIGSGIGVIIIPCILVYFVQKEKDLQDKVSSLLIFSTIWIVVFCLFLGWVGSG